MIKKRKTLKKRETAFERMEDVAVRMEFEEETDVPEGRTVEDVEDSTADSGRMGSPVPVVSLDFRFTLHQNFH